MDGPLGSITAVSLVLLLVLSAPVAGVAAATPGSLFGVQSVDPDRVILRVDIQPDGDAQWQVEYRVRLDSENESEAFEDLQADLEQNETAYLTDFQSRINSTVDAAENSSGREMSAIDYNVSARITQLPQEYGVLMYTFTWTNFAIVDGDQLTAGDALAGFFLDSETTLAFGWPSDYRTAEVSPEPSDRQTNAVLWRGPLDFADGEPRLVIEPEPAGGTSTTTTTDDGGATTNPGTDGEQGIGIGTTLGAIAAIVLLGVLGFLYVRRYGVPGQGPAGTPGGGAGPGTGGDGGPGTGGEASESATEGAGAAATAGGGAEETASELLSNEERVEQFLEARGGRAKQQEIVDGLEWTDAKTSQVLSGMAKNDRIEKFRIGRENVVKLPDEEGDEDSVQI